MAGAAEDFDEEVMRIAREFMDEYSDLLRRLRQHEPPVIGRIEQDRVLLDPRTVLSGEDDNVIAAVVRAMP